MALVVATAPSRAPAAMAPCSTAAPENCSYPPERPPVLESAPDQLVELGYPDITGAQRRFQIAIRRPLGAPEPLPVVVWSHGGARGESDPRKVARSWGEVLTGAGYLFVAIAHPGREMPERLALCAALGIEPVPCETFKFLNWDRPRDVRRVLDWLAEAADGERALAGRIDPHRIAYAGHSAGAGAALMVAGASREFGGSQRTIADTRPVAFLAASPQGAGHDGFAAASFAAIDRPFLTLSGEGDGTEGHPSSARRDAHAHMQPGAAWLGWIADGTARHGTFNLEPGACARAGGDPQRCADHLDWLSSAALAFLDAHVRDDAAAREYLESDRLRILSGGILEWSRR